MDVSKLTEMSHLGLVYGSLIPGAPSLVLTRMLLPSSNIRCLASGQQDGTEGERLSCGHRLPQNQPLCGFSREREKEVAQAPTLPSHVGVSQRPASSFMYAQNLCSNRNIYLFGVCARTRLHTRACKLFTQTCSESPRHQALGWVPRAGTEKHPGSSRSGGQALQLGRGSCVRTEEPLVPSLPRGKMPGSLPGGGSIQAAFCARTQPRGGASGEGNARSPQGDLSSVQPKQMTGTTQLRAGQDCPLARRSLGLSSSQPASPLPSPLGGCSGVRTIPSCRVGPAFQGLGLQLRPRT